MLDRGKRTGKKCESLADAKAREEGGRGCGVGAGIEIPLQPLRRTMVKQVVPLQPMEDHGGAGIHTAAHRGPQAGAGEKCEEEEATERTDLWTDHNPIPHPPAPLDRGKGLGVKE